MEVIRTRNAQSGIAPMLQLFYTDAEQEGGALFIEHPVVSIFEHPRERLVFWPGLVRDPAHELLLAATSLAPSEAALPKVAPAIKAGVRQFLFSTPQLVVQARIGGNGRMNLYVVLADANPFTGAFGQVGLQMSILLEMLAAEARVQVGEMAVQHQGLLLPTEVVERLLRLSVDDRPEDPYQTGAFKARKIDGPLNLAALVDPEHNAMGHKSKWIRHVAMPLIEAGKCETPQEALKLAANIKADDWRQALTDWCQATIEAEAFRKAQEKTDGQG